MSVVIAASLIRKRKNFLQQRKEKLEAASENLHSDQFVFSDVLRLDPLLHEFLWCVFNRYKQLVARVDDRIREVSEKGLRRQSSSTHGRQNVAEELLQWYHISPFRSMADTSRICNIVLPDSGWYQGVEPIALTSAMEHILNVVDILAQVLDVELSVHWRLMGAQSAIWRGTNLGVNQFVDSHGPCMVIFVRSDCCCSMNRAAAEQKIFFDSKEIDYGGIKLIEEAVCELCQHEGIDIPPENSPHLLLNLHSLLNKLLAPTTKYHFLEFQCDSEAQDALSVLSTLTPSPSAPLFLDAVDASAEGKHSCTVRVAAVDPDVVIRARNLLWTNLHADEPLPQDKPRQAEMFQRVLKMPGAVSVPAIKAGADVREAFEACMKQDVEMMRPPFGTRPFHRFSFVTTGSNPSVWLISRSEQSLRFVAEQMKSLLQQYYSITVTTTVASGGSGGTEVRSRTRSGPTKNRPKL